MKFLIFFFFIISCSSIGQNKQNKAIASVTALNKIETYKIFNGKVKFIKLNIDLADGPYTVKCEEQNSKKPLIKKFPIEVLNLKAGLYYAEGYHSRASAHECLVNGRVVFKIEVKQFPYKEEFLKVKKGKVFLSKKNQKRAGKEWLMMKKLYQTSSKKSLIKQEFKVPLDSFITSHYGKRRVFNNSKKTQHLGNDFRAKVGLPIPSSNNGKVLYVGNLFYTGNVVIIDHGVNLFTVYAHLSKIMVKTGDSVEQGQILGLAGKTGRVSGPHLHWGVKLHGFNIDGFSLVEESQSEFLTGSKKK